VNPLQKLTPTVSHNFKKKKMDEFEFGKKTKKIDLSNKNLKSIPREIFEMKELETLILTQNQIRTIPPTISILQNLKILDISFNQIKNLPENLFQLKNLESLNLSNNNIQNISYRITELKKLETLNLKENNLIIPPPEITHKENCKSSIFLYFEKFKEEEIKRSSLTWELYENLNKIKLKVEDVDYIEFNRKIKDIDISEDILMNDIQIKNVKTSQRKLEELLKAYESIQKSFKFEFDDDILVKIKDSQDLTKTYKLFESKLIFVGEERAGKTSLIKTLTKNDFTLNVNEVSTQGIDITHWSIPKEKLGIENDFRLNIWDFGGQEIYHATHQFFLTKRSIYILVTEARKDVRHDDFYYWLNLIKHLAGQSPVLIVTNKIDQPNTGMAIDNFKKIFPNIIDEYRVSCLSEHEETISVLKRAIFNIVKSKKLLPHVGTPLPKVYIDIRNEINKFKEAGELYISSNQYFEICKKYNVNYADSSELCSFFHDLGVFLHFEDDEDLQDTIFLNFEFITKAVYNVLDNFDIIGRHGYFTKKDLTNIWTEPELKDKQNELLALMKNKKFDLCFELKDGRYLAPQLLPHQQPQFNWTHTAQKTINFEIAYTFLPKGIISRLIVRLNEHVYNNLYWRYGVVLDYKNTKAFIEEIYFQRKIVIRVVGKQSKKLLDIVLNHIREINSEFTNLDWEEMVPCNCTQCSNRSNDTYFFKHSELKRFLIELNRKTKECGYSGEQVDINRLILGTFLKNGNYSNKINPEQTPQKQEKKTEKSLPWIIILFVLIGISSAGIIHFFNSKQVILWLFVVVALLSLTGLYYFFDKEKISEKGFLKGFLAINKKIKLPRKPGKTMANNV
jgi:small GTP-binding protein